MAEMAEQPDTMDDLRLELEEDDELEEDEQVLCFYIFLFAYVFGKFG